MNNNPHITHLICKYIQPSKLISFFISHNLNHEMKLIYDSYPYTSTASNITTYFKHFPNLILKGVSIDIMPYSREIFDFPSTLLNKLTRVKLRSSYKYSINALNSRNLHKINHITHLTIEYITIHTFSFLQKFNNLRSIKINKCPCPIRINNFINLPNLRVIKMPTSYVSSNDIHVFSQCTNLKKLEITNTWDTNIPIIIKHLKHLKINNYHYASKIIQTIHLSLFNECTNLRTLNIKNSLSIICITPTKYKLRKLIITNSHSE